MTGIDRVERAYLARLLSLPSPVWGLVRSSLGFLLLDRAGMETVGTRIDETSAPAAAPNQPGLRQWLFRASTQREADLAAVAVARTHRLGLGRMLTAHLPAGTAYLNVGHSNLTPQVLSAWRKVDGAQVTVMIHDTIPLDLPALQRPGTAARFRRKLAAVSTGADLLLYVSAATRTDAERHLAGLGRIPDGIVAPIGVAPAAPDPAGVPPDLRPDGAYFVVLGTIEPRKNHALLLDIWDRFATEGRASPHLLVLGARGWNNAVVFARLDTARDGLVREAAGLPDAAVAALLQGSAGLLMPSRAEGFGLPVAEAVALGVPVVASALPVYRETVGDAPIYLPADDERLWTEAIRTLAEGRHPSRQPEAPGLPSWEDHFKAVLTTT